LRSTFSSDHRFFAWQEYGQGGIALGDLKSVKMVKRFSADLSHKPHRPTFVSGSDTPDPTRNRLAFDRLAVSQDNRYLAAAWNSTLATSLRAFESTGEQKQEPSTIYVWNTTTGKGTARIVFDPAAKMMPQLTCLAFTRDCRTLAAGFLGDADVHLIEVASGRQRGVLRGHQGMVRSFALSPDGRRLLSGSDDTTILVWELDHLPSVSSRVGKDRFSPGELNRLWMDLASSDAAIACGAIAALRGSPEQAVALLKDHLRPVPEVGPERIKRRIEELDSADFTVRSRATTELERMEEIAEPALRKALEKPSSLEVRLRLQRLVDWLNPLPLPPDRLRPLRALEVLEAVGNSRALELLGELAVGAPLARLTREAKESLERLTPPGGVPEK
jgi:hypothetical protein